MFNHLLSVLAAVAQPELGKGRKIEIVSEDCLRCFVFLELDQQAALANIGVQRVGWFRSLDICSFQKRVGQRRPTEIHKAAGKLRGTISTANDIHCHLTEDAATDPSLKRAI